MALGLVARTAVALSDHINGIYRVLKGTDPDSLAVRLPTAGSFEVRHSVTAAPMLRVTDAGLSGVVQGGDIVDGTITSAEIADDTIVDADINSAAAIAVTKLAHVGANNVLKSTGTANVGAQIVDGDVANAASIAVAKLAHLGANNVLKSNGTVNVAGQVVNADISASAGVAVSKLAAGGAANRVVATTDGTAMTMQQVVDAMVGAAAAIGLTKVAHVGANNVLKSTGTANVGAQIVNADIASGADIDGAKLLNGSITTAKLGAGITAPGVALIASSGVLGAPAAAITFTPIAGTYQHLELRIYGRSTGAVTAQGVMLRCNNASSGLYAGEYMQAAGATTVSGELGPPQTFANIGNVPGASATAQFFGAMAVTIPNYASAVGYHSIISINHYATANVGAANNFLTGFFGNQWYGGAITRLDVTPVSGSWAAGSQISLYGWN